MRMGAAWLEFGRRIPPGLVWRSMLAVLVSLTLSLQVPGEALAAPKFAALAVDARNGKVLYSNDADGIRHPASLTKMMTLYLLFQDLKAGKIKLDSPIRMSATAASKPPTKLGVKPGNTFPVEIAIKALVVKSANDVAAAVAENLGGTEAAFAQRMTRTARALGMSRTTFRNASGLPDARQVTTARDMATLGLRLMRDFPQYYPYFRTTSFTYGGKTISTHNRLLKSYEGTDGIKTGYINASGFNLVSSVRRGEQRLVGVVIGGKSGAGRNAYMVKMLNSVFAKASKGQTIAALAGSSKGAVNPVATAPAEQKKKPQNAKIESTIEPKEIDSAPEGVGDREEPMEETAGAPQVIDGSVGQPVLPKELPFAVKSKATAASDQQTVASIPTESWVIQIGAYRTKSDAEAQLRAIRNKVGDHLADKQAFTMTVQKGEETTYRARFSGFSEKSAKAACKAVKKQKSSCYVLAPAS